MYFYLGIMKMGHKVTTFLNLWYSPKSNKKKELKLQIYQYILSKKRNATCGKI